MPFRLRGGKKWAFTFAEEFWRNSALAFAIWQISIFNKNLLQGILQQAILYYHKCLAVKPEDTFAGEMLTIAMQEECGQTF